MSTISPIKDFFISYNRVDREWAVWIAWELEQAGYAVIIQEWDFRGNFVLEMDRGHREASRTIAVLSPDYVKSLFVQPEWAARLAQDPAGRSDRLIPLQVREVELEGLLAQIIYTDLVGLDESQARDRLLKRASGQRLKPAEKPGFPGLRTVGERPSFPGTSAPPIDRRAYAKQAHKLFDVLDLTALAQPGAIDPDVERPRLSQLFVPQYARRSRPPQTLPRDYLNDQELDPDDEVQRPDFQYDHWSRAERLPVLDLLATPEAHSAVLLGDPGSGKSSLARYLLLQLLKIPDDGAELPAWRQALGDGLPFLLELRDFIASRDEGICDDIIAYLAYLGKQRGLGFTRSQLERALVDDNAFVIFDGLDEIFDIKSRGRAVLEIIGFVARFPLARVLITSRIAGFSAHPFEAAEFAIFTLDDLDDVQIQNFARAWFDIALPNRPREAERARNDLLETLNRRPNLKVLAGNPLLLTIMAIVARHERLARSRAKLYEQALKVLSYGWDARKELELPADSAIRDLGPDDRLELLRQVAWRMNESGEGLKANAIAEASLRDELERYFAVAWNFDKARQRRASREMIDLLEKRTWILTLRGPALYGFVHRTFLEYLCASELLRRLHDGDVSLDELQRRYVLDRGGDDTWREVIRLFFAQVSCRQANVLIDKLIGQACGNHLALAFECLAEREARDLARMSATCNGVMELLYKDVRSFGTFLCDLNDGKECRSIGDSLKLIGHGWPNRELLRKRDLPRTPIAFAGYSEIVGGLIGLLADVPNTLDRLQKLIANDLDEVARAAGLHALAEHFREEPGTKVLLLQRASEDESGDVRISALAALVRYYAEAPETKRVLLQRATEDGNSETRSAALLTLAQHYREAPETKPLLLQCAAGDDICTVRGAALDALARHYREAEETKPLLVQLALEDESVQVRYAGLKALTDYYPAVPESKRLLLQCATEDKSWEVRRIALATMVRHYREAPETKLLLLQCAAKDQDGDMRSAALVALMRHYRAAPEIKPVLLPHAGEAEAARLLGPRERYRVAIVGSGPAGLSAGARAAALGLSHIVLEGQRYCAHTIRRYQRGILVRAMPDPLPLRSDISFAARSREEILDTWQREIVSKGINVCYGAEVKTIAGQKGAFIITLTDGSTFEAEFVVLATGLQGTLRKLGVPGEDLPFVQYQLDDPDEIFNETIVIVGSGDSGIENAMALAKQNRVVIVSRRDDFDRARLINRIAIEKAIETGTLECIYNAAPMRVEPGVIYLRVRDGMRECHCDRVIARLGAMPPRKFIEMCGVEFPSDDPNALPVVSVRFESNVPGLYIIGALASYGYIKQAMNHGYEVIEFIAGRDVKPVDYPILQAKLSGLPGRLSADLVPEIKRKVALFHHLTTLQLRELLLVARIHSAPQGQRIFESNDYGDTLFCIVFGTVEIDVRDDHRPGSSLSTVLRCEGDFFGEAGLISGRCRIGTARAKTGCFLIELSRRSVLDLFPSAPAAKNLFDHASILHQLQEDVLPGLTEAGLADLLARAKLERFDHGRTVMDRDEDCLYLIRAGAITTSRRMEGKADVMSYYPAGHLLRKTEPDGATCTAVSRTEVIRIAGAALRTLLNARPELRYRIEQT